MDKPTPTPWTFTDDSFIQKGDIVIAEIYGLNGWIPKEGYEIPKHSHANGEFIVRAVNAHEELLTLLKACAGFAAMSNGFMYDGKPLSDAIRQAIAKAEGK